MDAHGGYTDVPGSVAGSHEHQRREYERWDDRDERGRLHDAAVGYQSDLHDERVSERVDTVHGNVEWDSVTDDRSAGSPLFCGERRADRSELRLHWSGFADPAAWLPKVHAAARSDRNPIPDSNASSSNADQMSGRLHAKPHTNSIAKSKPVAITNPTTSVSDADRMSVVFHANAVAESDASNASHQPIDSFAR